MKYLLSLLFLFSIHLAFSQNVIILKRDANNAIYIPDASKLIPPGSVVQFQGDYLYVKIFNVQGTADKPITFINKGLVRIGGFKSYTFQVQGTHFVVNGSGDSAIK